VAPEDDDANAAVKAAPVSARKIGRAEMETLDDLLDRTETPRERFYAYAKVDGMADITIDQYDSLVKMLGRKLAEVKA
jgi:hypothetical protein